MDDSGVGCHHLRFGFCPLTGLTVDPCLFCRLRLLPGFFLTPLFFQPGLLLAPGFFLASLLRLALLLFAFALLLLSQSGLALLFLTLRLLACLLLSCLFLTGLFFLTGLLLTSLFLPSLLLTSLFLPGLFLACGFLLPRNSRPLIARLGVLLHQNGFDSLRPDQFADLGRIGALNPQQRSNDQAVNEHSHQD